MCGFSRMVSWTLLGAKGLAIAAGKAQDDIEQRGAVKVEEVYRTPRTAMMTSAPDMGGSSIRVLGQG